MSWLVGKKKAATEAKATPASSVYTEIDAAIKIKENGTKDKHVKVLY